jgi:hypothetical protein
VPNRTPRTRLARAADDLARGIEFRLDEGADPGRALDALADLLLDLAERTAVADKGDERKGKLPRRRRDAGS